MLSLVLILCVIGVVFAGRRCWKKKTWYYLAIIYVCIVLGMFVFVSELVMFFIVRQEDTGYLQQQVETLTEVKSQMDKWIEIVKDELSDNPELLNHVEAHLKEDIDSNDEEIQRCNGLREERVPLYRWLLYFG